ncbi:hypothetical protein ACVNPS_02760 [Candidatus Bipolaricaulota sp. J31]
MDRTGLSAASLGLEYQTASFALWGTAEFTPAGFALGTVGTELRLTEFLGFTVEVAVDDAGFAGADFFLWYEAGVEEGSSGFTGLLELDREGAVVGQILRFGLDFPPFSLESTAWFDEAGLTELELVMELVGEAVAMGLSSTWTPNGLGTVGGNLSGTLGTVVTSGEISCTAEGDWIFAGELLFGDVFSIQGQVTFMEGMYGAEAGVEGTWEYVGFRFGLGSETAGFRCTGALSFTWDDVTIEVRGSLFPAGEWTFELFLDLVVLSE